MVEKDLEADQQSRMIVGSSTSMTFKTIVEFRNGNRSLVVELIPTIDLLSSDHRRSMWIEEPQLLSGLILHPSSTIEVVRLLLSQSQSSIFESIRSDNPD
jgi:hypothetical protein